MTPVFEAGASLIVRNGQLEKTQDKQDAATVPEGNPASAAEQYDQEEKAFQTALEVLQGNVLAEQVITSLQAARLFPDLARETRDKRQLLRLSLAAFQQQLTVEPVALSRTLRVTFQHEHPETAVKVIETLLQLFEKEYRRLLNPEIALQEEALLAYLRKMQQAENALAMFQQTNHMFHVGNRKEELAVQDAQRKNLLAGEQKKMEKQSAAQNALEQQFAEALVAVAPERAGKKKIQEDMADFLRLKVYEHELVKRHGEDDPLIADVRQQLSFLRKNLYGEAELPAEKKEELEAMADRIVLAKAEYTHQQEKNDALQRTIRQQENKLQSLAEQEKVLDKLRSELDNRTAQYREFAEQFEAERKKSIYTSHVRVIEKPVLPLAPVRPQKLRIMLWAAGIGLLGSLLYASVRSAWSCSSDAVSSR
ncbi:MAG: GNVR domain-containing protein [Candidatus Electrothrix sp. YB6]